ncbi:MAG TPA: nitroreductase family protein [Spirochaetia bacterium]|nr:nitroreductase family protein [Spirochaetia bacterium]
MELTEVIGARRSIRKFKPDPLSEHMVTELLEAARLAPSGTNIQPWRFAVVKSAEMRQKVQDCCISLKFLAAAPVIFVAMADPQALLTRAKRMQELAGLGAFTDTGLEGPQATAYFSRPRMDENLARAYLYLNTAIAIEHLVLRATDLGLGSCWVRMFDEARVRTLLAVPEHFHVVALIPVGYPDQQPPARPRLPQGEILWRTF